MENNIFWLRIALNAPEMEIRITNEENKRLRNNKEPISMKREIIANAIQNRFINLGDNSSVDISYDDFDITVPMDERQIDIKENESEETKMETQNSMDILGFHLVELANIFNHVILFDDNYANDDEQNKNAYFCCSLLENSIELIEKLGYTVKTELRECRNTFCHCYGWNEYVKFDMTNTATGEIKTFYCNCSTRKYKVTITNVIECETCNKDEAERIAREKMNLDWCSDYETECIVEERR